MAWKGEWWNGLWNGLHIFLLLVNKNLSRKNISGAMGGAAAAGASHFQDFRNFEKLLIQAPGEAGWDI
jgi:hypothetical protein